MKQVRCILTREETETPGGELLAPGQQPVRGSAVLILGGSPVYTSSLKTIEESGIGESRKERVRCPGVYRVHQISFSLLQTLLEVIPYPFPAAVHTRICPALPRGAGLG